MTPCSSTKPPAFRSPCSWPAPAWCGNGSSSQATYTNCRPRRPPQTGLRSAGGRRWSTLPAATLSGLKIRSSGLSRRSLAQTSTGATNNASSRRPHLRPPWARTDGHDPFLCEPSPSPAAPARSLLRQLRRATDPWRDLAGERFKKRNQVCLFRCSQVEGLDQWREPGVLLSAFVVKGYDFLEGLHATVVHIRRTPRHIAESWR